MNTTLKTLLTGLLLLVIIATATILFAWAVRDALRLLP